MNIKLNLHDAMKRTGISPIQIHLIGSSLTLFAIGLSAYGVYSAWESRKSGIESSQNELTKVSTQLSETQRERGRLVNQISTLQSIVKEHSSDQQPESINQLAVQVVAMAEDFEVRLEQFEPSAETVIEGDRVQPINVRLSAPYPTLTRWLDEIHETMPDMHVVGLSIQTQGEDSTTVRSDIQFNWYIPATAAPSE